MTTNRLTAYTAMLVGGLLVASATAKAQTWSSAASVCQPGSDSIGLYSFDNSGFKFSGSNTGQIKVRCAVTNPKDSGVPSWSTLTVGYVDPDGTGVDYQVDAQLVRVGKSAKTSYIIKTFDSSSFATTTAGSRSVTFTHTFDFTNYAYYVTATVTRGDANQSPEVWFVELK
ncbi:MAG TPA: hypothetical protein VMG35_26495 [Bryobacteraceae bacterium]|nr:hypothetical protein [Bryobacteraceae bacterium]